MTAYLFQRPFPPELVGKYQDPQDRRLVRITLTPGGRKIVDDTFLIMENAYSKITGSWTLEEPRETAERLARVLEKLAGIK